MVYSATVVRISTPVNDVSEAVGTGFCIENTVTDDVIFLTNAHVVADGQRHHIEVAWAPGKLIPVHVAAIVYDRDLALIKCPKNVWEETAHEYLSGDELETILNVPTEELGFDCMFETTGTEIRCCGHPLGLPTQQVCTGITRGVIDMGVLGQRTLISAAINHGNSGGMCQCVYEGRKVVIGITTMKLSGHDVEQEGGIINIGTVRACLPHMMRELKPPEYDMSDPRIMAALEQIMKQAGPSLKSLQPKHQHWLAANWETHLEKWCSHSVGGKVRGEPRPFGAWVMRHVYSDGKFLENGAQLLNFVVQKSIAGEYSTLAQLNAEHGGWKAIRTGTEVATAALPFQVVITKDPAVLYEPRHGLQELQPTHNLHACKTFYGCTKGEKGAIINIVLPNSLYKLGGGKEGDLIHAFQKIQYAPGVETPSHIIPLDNNGQYTDGGALGTRYTVASMCNNVEWFDSSISNWTEVRFFVKREGGVDAVVQIKIRPPDMKELPAMHRIMPFNNESQQGGADIMGFKLVQVHANHIEKFKLVEYADVSKHDDFRLICVDHPPGGVKIAPGATLLSMNGIDASMWTSWKDFQKDCEMFEKISLEHKQQGKSSHFTAVFGRSGGFKARVIIEV